MLGEGPPDLNLLDPRVRQEHMPQSLVPCVGSETHDIFKVTTATSVKARGSGGAFPTSQGRGSVRV